MTVHGIPKPGWRGFQLLKDAGNARVPVNVTEHTARVVEAAQAQAKAQCLQGGFTGGDIHADNMTIAAAEAWCLASDKCAGFTTTGQYPTPCTSAAVFGMHFKDAWGVAHRDVDPMLVSWLAKAAPPPPPPPAMVCNQGALPAGGDIRVANSTIAAAVAWCQGNTTCTGFSTKSTGCQAAASSGGVFQVYFKANMGGQNTDSAWHTWLKPPPTTTAPLVSAFATVNTSSGLEAMSTLRVYLGFWSVLANGAAPPANRTVSLKVAAVVSGARAPAADADGAATTATLWRIDAAHANPLAAWQAMGSPDSPSAAQLASLIASSVVHPVQVPARVRRVAGLAGLAGQARTAAAAEVEVEVAVQVHMIPNSAVLVTFA